MHASFSLVFNSDDADTAEFLSAVGVSPRQIQNGEMTVDDLVFAGIDPDAFLKLLEIAVYPEGTEFSSGLFENLEYGFLEMNEVTAAYASGFWRDNESPLLKSLLRYGAGPDGDTARIILDNLYADSAAFYSERPDGVTPETDCTLAELTAAGFLAGDLAGIAFEGEMTGAFWREISKAVIPISMWDGEGEEYAGSAVIVSPAGHVMTAAHNIIQANGEVFADLSLRYGGGEVPIEESDILYVDVASDVAILKVPFLSHMENLPYVYMAQNRPAEGEDVMVIGFPVTVGADASVGEFPEAYTLGQYFYSLPEDVSPEETADPLESHTGIFLLTTARAFPGNSGGGFFNARGELIGITSNVETAVNHSEAASVLLEDADDAAYESVLREIRGAQITFR